MSGRVYYLRFVGDVEPYSKAYTSQGGARAVSNSINGRNEAIRGIEHYDEGYRASLRDVEVVVYSLTFVGVV